MIGVSDTRQFDSFGNPIDHAFRWSKGGMQDLGTLGDVNSIGLGGNDKGAVLGNNWYNINHALLWYKGAAADLGTLVGPSGYSWAQQINNAGQAVGGSEAADGTFHAVLWDQGAINAFALQSRQSNLILAVLEWLEEVLPLLDRPNFQLILAAG